jgi:hypothetical protein
MATLGFALEEGRARESAPSFLMHRGNLQVTLFASSLQWVPSIQADVTLATCDFEMEHTLVLLHVVLESSALFFQNQQAVNFLFIGSWPW